MHIGFRYVRGCEMALTPGTRLGPYKILGVLGTGGMGEVYRASDSRLDRDVAIKVILSGLADEKERIQRFSQEAKALSLLNHPNIVTIHGLETFDGMLCLVTEFLEGENLRKRMEGKPMQSRKAAEIALQIARGLAAAAVADDGKGKGKGIVHRDLKPENVFLTKDGQVKILDFGLAKIRQGDEPELETERTGGLSIAGASGPLVTMEGCILGTVNYMSPEQVRSELLDGRSDIFSLGVMLWEMVTGARPFRGGSPIEVMTSILKDDLPDLNPALKIPPILERILNTCLAKQPSARFQSAHDLAFALEEACGVGTSSLSASYAQVKGKPPSFFRRYLTHSLAMLVAAGALTFAFLRPEKSLPTYKRLTYRHGNIHGGRFTPDGRQLLYDASWSGGPWQVNATNLQTAEDRPVGPPGAQLLAISKSGEIAYKTAVIGVGGQDSYRGTLAKSPQMGNYSPRPIRENVEWADYDSADQMIVVETKGGRSRLEYPMGELQAESQGWISCPRISPKGDAIAYLEHPFVGDNIGYLCLWKKEGKHARRVTKLWVGGIQGLAWRGDEIWFTASEDVGVKGLWAYKEKKKPRKILQVPGDLIILDISTDGKVAFTQELARVGALTGEKGGGAPSALPVKGWTMVSGIFNKGGKLLIEEQGEATEQGYRIYLSHLDGSNTTFLGEGRTPCISPDEQWVATLQPKPRQHIVLIPTGVGRPESLDYLGLANIAAYTWCSNDKLMVIGNEEGKGWAIYQVDLSQKKMKFLIAVDPALVPEIWVRASMDGAKLLFGDRAHTRLLNLRGSPLLSLPVKGLNSEDRIFGWTEDSRTAFLGNHSKDPLQIYKWDPVSGKREPWLVLDKLNGISPSHTVNLYLTSDGKKWALTYHIPGREMYLVEGL